MKRINYAIYNEIAKAWFAGAEEDEFGTIVLDWAESYTKSYLFDEIDQVQKCIDVCSMTDVTITSWAINITLGFS